MNRFIFELELKEEWRMLTSYFTSKKMFYLFPVVLFSLGFLSALLSPLARKAFDPQEFFLAIHLVLLFYGIFVGGFGFFAEEIATRWFLEARLLIHMHALLPVAFRRIFFWFYVKDIVYYLFMTVYPLFFGAFVSFYIPIPFFFKMLVSSTLSFLLGVSLSFFASSLFVKSRYSLIFLSALTIVLGLKYSLRDFPSIAFFFHPDIISLALSLIVFFALSAISLLITEPVERGTKNHFPKSRLFFNLEPMLAKEVLDVVRSGTYRIILTSYLFPLLFVYGIFHFSEKLLNFRLDIPLVFYAGFMGYLSTLVYSWLHNMDPPSSFTTLPIRISEIIKRKMRLFLFFSFIVGFAYLLILGYVLEDLSFLPLSFFCMGATTFYVAAVTAYLCGLNPNTMLFEGTVLARYLASILPVLVSLSILSFMKAYTTIFFISFVVLLLSTLIYRKLDRKYEGMNL